MYSEKSCISDFANEIQLNNTALLEANLEPSLEKNNIDRGAVWCTLDS